MNTENNVAPYMMTVIAVIVIAWTMIATMQAAVPLEMMEATAPQTHGMVLDYIAI